ncbi:MAG: Zn-dependent hydrolase, partial [Afipia sp.]|nr:Zn-dependent hydrolase [Afipia sp.]
GFASHAGTTPMPLRKDALAAFSEVVLAVEKLARDHGPHAVGTIGEVKIDNPSRNVIPGDLAFSAEFRSPESATLDALHEGLQKAV